MSTKTALNQILKSLVVHWINTYYIVEFEQEQQTLSKDRK